MKKLFTSSKSLRSGMNYFLFTIFILVFLLSGIITTDSSAQSDNSLQVPKIPAKRKITTIQQDQKSNLPPDPSSPAIIRNVPGSYATIQAAIDAAGNGDIVLVASGTYREDIYLNKYLKIRGANYGVNPNTGIRVAETVIQPFTSDPVNNTYFYIGPNGSSSVIDGFTFDGDNTTITSGIVINGADIDAAEAIGAYEGLSNTTISNNIIKNLNYAGIDLYNYVNGGAATFDNLVTDNKFDNIIPSSYGIGVLIYNNCYTSISNNVMTRVRIGIQTGNFYSADLGTSHSINNNNIESYRLGIFHNLAYTNATSYIITNNIFTTLAGAPNNIGIELSSIGSAVGVTVTDNNITGARNGYNLWNCTSTNTVTITGGVLTNCSVGVFANNYDGYTSNADPGICAMTGITMTNCDTAIWVRDNNLNTNNATITLNINNSTNFVNGTGIGLLIEGEDASVVFSAGDPIDFNTSLSKYIRLITNGSNVPSANINAQDVKFGGTKGSGLTDAQLFAAEDKIDHKTDWNTLGFVSVKANNDYVTINSFYTPNTTTPAIQRGIDAATSGYTINVAAGTYIENFAVNKNNVILRGPNYGINPNTGSRVSEAIIMPAVDDPETGVLISLEQSNIIMDGFLLNGDNPGLNAGYSVGGADVNTSEGICNGPALGPYFQIDHIDLQNNIFNNFDYQAIYLEVAFNSNHSWNYVKNNKFNNMWEGVQTYALHTDISYNVFTGVDRALSMHSYHAATDAGFLPQIAYNTVSITWKTGYSRNIGIWVNYRDGSAPSLEIKNNTINCSDASLIGKNFFGFYALTLKDNRVVTFADNTITGAGNCSRGLYMTNCPSSNVSLTGGAFNNIRDYGILMVNNDLSWGSGDSRLTVNNLVINMSPGSYAGVLDSTDNNYLNTSTGSNLPAYRISRKDEVVIDKSVTNNSNTSPGSTVTALNISNSTINGGATGIKVKGTQASANIHDNPSTITGAVIGVDVDGGSAALYRNNITANGTGVRVKNSGNLDSAMENYITSNTADGINIEATAGNIGIVSNNDLSANTGYSIKYLKPTPALSASCNWYGSALAATVASKITGNVNYLNFLTNGADNDGGTNGFQITPGSCNGLGPVVNITQNISYVAIQPAVNAANNGDIIEVDPGTYNEQVLINKEVTIKNSGAKPVINFTGTPSLVSGKLTMFEITVPNVTIDSLDFEVDLAKLGSAIIASSSNINNLTIKNNDINPYKSGALVSFGTRNAVNINYGAYRINSANPSNILAEKNNITYNFYGTPMDPSDDAGFRAGFATDEGGGTFTLNTIQTISQDIEARFGGAGDINVTNNNINGGGVNLAEYNAGAGNINVTGNIFDGAFGNTYSSSLRLKNNQQIKTTLISGNTFQNHNWGISLENYRAVTVTNNTFTPVSASTVFRHITVNTKLLASTSATITQTAIDATFTNNTFSGSGTPGGTGMAFYNHDSDNDTYGTFTIGTIGNENNFNTGIAKFIALDPSTGPSWPSAFPENNLGAGAITTMACWDQNLDIVNNKFDVGSGLQLPASMNFTNRNLLETALFHKPDNSCLGNLSYFMPVHNLTQNTYFMTIQSAVNAANPTDVIECAEYTYNERLTIDKTLTLQGVDKTNCVITGTGLVGTGKGIQINNAVTGVTIKRFTVQNFAGSSGNADAGIYGIGGNNNLLIEGVIIQNNVGGSGFYANGPVNTVTLDTVISSGHSTGARGIVIWNGLKENITVTNCEVFNNNCCGLELQDGQASGVTFENNNIHDNADNGIGLIGLQGPGENLIKNNTLLNNGRFGIEIKNPNGSGLTTGPGRIVVENNNVSRTVAIVDARDIAGIAAFRRGVLAGNVEIPTGVVIQNNTVSGYVQASTSDGFGIVVEGMNHTVSGNTVSGCDVGIQRQAGHLPAPPSDGDQNNVADTYFGRGNSAQTCGITIGINTLTNTINTRDVGASAGGFVTNLNTTEVFCSIQAAIDDAQTLSGHVIEIGAGTYNERVVVNKTLTLQGTNKTTCIIDGTGLVGLGKGIQINNAVTGVTIKRLTVQNFAGSSGNADAGIYGIGGNNNLLIEGVIIQNNVGGSGFYANGPVNTVTLDTVVSSGHSTGARGIVIWNGLKENITVTNCEVFNNNCCGLELQDGQASGVTFENNNIHDNADNGIGLIGLQGPGENLIKNNTLLNNGRFGIEIKNPNGSGLTTGPGRIVVENNNVSRNVAIVDNRDIAGIAAFRRGVLAGNVEIPTGVVIQNNTVSGYAQPSTSEGFGIVVEGLNHTVSGNTVSGCDVGIQKQAGHLPAPPSDGDQSNVADTYFGRGNATQTCGVTVSGNILTNTINTRDVGAGTGIVKNFNTGKLYCTIQSAINDVLTLNGHIIEVSDGTYNEQVLVNKSLVIKGTGAAKSIVDFTGTVSGKPTIFDVSVPNVTIENLRIRVDMTKLNSAIIASATDIDNLNIKLDSIEAYGSSGAATFGSYGNWNAVSINYSGSTNYRVAAGGVDNISVTGNTISGVLNDGFGQPRYFRSGVSLDEGGGEFNNNTIQTINHDLLVRFGSNGNIDFKNNLLNGGGLEMDDMNAGAGILTVSDNILDATFANTSAPGTAVMRFKNNYNSKTTLINRNTVSNLQWGVSLENYNSVTLDSNTFSPLAGSTVYHHVAINNKSISSNSSTILQVTIGAVLTRNTFNNSGTLGGTALSFHNHDNDAASFGTFTIGSSGNENIFKNGVLNFIYLDAQTGASSGSTFPAYTSLIGAGATAITTMACWSTDLNIENNKFDVGAGLQLPSSMNFAQRTALEVNLFHKPDNSCLGNLGFFLPVHNITQNSYFMTIQSAINAANPTDVIECAEYTYNERVTIDKTLTLQGVNKTNCIITGTGLVGTGKGIQINNAVTGVTIKRFTVQNFAGSSGNADAGIYGIGGNNNLLVEGVIIQNNVGGSGFYANGPVNTVTLDTVISSGHSTGARGIVIWNGLKENITVTNCEVFNNNCCGLELQDGQASGVTFENNNIHDNADNGIGLLGLQGPGENLIKNNTLLNNGRFGIEIKNPNGSGLTTGPGRIVVENNNVSRSVAIGGELRDIAGIAAFRRSVGAGNVDVPTGVVIQNNTVSGYVQPSTSDGFGIVVEGLSHTVSGNTISGCDVGIQRQAGHLPAPPSDGDQNNLADTYFGRGNSPQTCGITIGVNTLTNTINTRDVGVLAGGGIVQNINTSELFCSIQSAIDDPQTLDGHTISISAGTYTENLTLSKRLTLDGAGSGSDPTVSTIVQSVAANTPDIQITSTGLNAGNRVTVKDLRVTGATGSSNTGAGILVQSSVPLGYYTFDNLVSRVNQGAGIAFNSTVSVTDVVVTNSVLSMNGNDGLRIASAVPSFSDLNVSGSQIDSNATSGFDYNPSGIMTNIGTNFNFTNTSFTRNSTANITNAHDVSFFRFFGNATLTNVNVTSNQLPNKAYGIAFTGTNAAAGTVQLNGVTCNGIVGKGTLTFQQYNDINNISLNNVDVQSTTAPWGQVIIEHTDADALNIGNTTLRSLVLWNSGGVDATAANFRHITLGTPLSNAVLADNFQIEDQIVHKIDLMLLGLAKVKAGEVFVTVNSFVTPNTTPSIQRGIDAASAGFIVNAGPGNFTEQLEVNKALTIDGQGSGITNIISPNTLALSYTTSGVNKPVIYVHDAADVIIKDITVDGAGKGNANNRFQGIAYRNAGGTVRNCDIKAIRNTPIDGSQAGVGIYALADNGTMRTLNFIRNNVFDFQKNATVFAGSDLSAKIDSNTITGAGAVNFIAQNGVQLSNGAAGSVRHNTISNLSYTPSTAVSCGVLLYQSSGPDTTSNNTLTACQMGIYYIDVGGVIRENTISATAVNTGTIYYYGIDADPGGTPRVKIQPIDGQEYGGSKKVNISNSPASITTSIFRNTLTSDGTNGTGIEMDALGTETLNATALENKVNGWDAAIYFYKDAGATLNGVANDNNLSGNTFALYNQTGVIQNCTCNWYGTILPATILTKISGIVNSSPFLTNGTDFNAAPGFQPVPGSCNGLLASTLNIKVIQEGFYNTGTQTLNKKDTVRVYLHLDFAPYSVLDSAISTIDQVTFTGSFTFNQPSGNYYIVVKHRNTIETWSKTGGEVFTAGTIMNYDFTDAALKAFSNNLIQVDNSPVRFGIFSGDVNQDGTIDGADISQVSNDAVNSLSGYVPSDVTGDDFVDASDLSIVENNAYIGVNVENP